MNETKPIEKTRCWACDTLSFPKRIESHHLFGNRSEDPVLLCVTCHDLCDRMSLSDIEVFSEFHKAFEELEQLPRGSTKYLKLLLLKTTKLIVEQDSGN